MAEPAQEARGECRPLSQSRIPPVSPGRVAFAAELGDRDRGGVDAPHGKRAGLVGEHGFSAAVPAGEEHDVAVVEQDVAGLEVIPGVQGLANRRQVLGGDGPGEPPAAGNEAGAVDPAGVATGAGVAKAALGGGGDIPGRLASIQRGKKFPRGVEAAPLVRHSDGSFAGFPPAALGQRGVGGVNFDAVGVRPVQHVALPGPPFHPGVGKRRGDGLAAGHGGRGRRYRERIGRAGGDTKDSDA
ncbi:hypothetical protein Hsar01_02638 [Haloferula sargassicola]|uniref:Uncharacterized protein n=1 Tax=Haloferula sargassicola TaxID=490096 RepID=A0ABP9URR3_9BACT